MDEQHKAWIIPVRVLYLAPIPSTRYQSPGTLQFLQGS